MIEKIVKWLFKKNTEPEHSSFTFQEKEYKNIAEEALQEAIITIESDNWKKEKVDGEDIIYTKVVPKYGKIYKFVVSLIYCSNCFFSFLK